jgi:hypothetical protein
MGVTPIWPNISPFAESKPADIIIKSGLNSFITGKNNASQAYI